LLFDSNIDNNVIRKEEKKT